MSPSISVRSALAQDKAAVISFCQNTFSWGDYIAEVYDDWLADPYGQLLVGLADDRPAAILHVALLGNRVAWLEGMRVHSDFRRLGFATTLDIAARNFARERGCSVARLATSSKNIAAQGALGPLGYRHLARTDSWVAPPTGVGDPHLPVATSEDLSAIVSIWEGSPERKTSAGLVPDPRWRWTELTTARLQAQIKDKQIRILPGGFSIVQASSNPDGPGEYVVHALAGDADSMRTLALGARAEAATRGFPNLEAMVPYDDHLAGILSGAGYVREGAMLIYEIDL